MQNCLRLRLHAIFGQRKCLVDILSIFFGIGTWIGVNGIFIQLPLLVKTASEGWKLPSYLAIMVQLGNFGPIAYTFLRKWSKKTDAYLIYDLLSLASLSSLLTIFFYQKRAKLFDMEYSVALFALTFLMSLNACTSSVLFMPYMGRFKEIYLVTYFIGEGLSGLLPSIVSLIQGIGGSPQCILTNITSSGENIYEKYTSPPRFSSSIFFSFIFVMMILSYVGFILLNTLNIAKKEYANVHILDGNDYTYDRSKKNTTLTNPLDNSKDDETQNTTDNSESVNNQIDYIDDLSPEITNKQYKLLLLLIGIIGFFANGIFNSIQSFSCLPYGYQAYHLSATLSVLANPIACFLGMFLTHTSILSILIMTLLIALLTIYVFVTAIMSPSPPLQNTNFGEVLIIMVWTLLVGLVSYLKLSITSVMRAQGGKSLVWVGALTQFGSMIGSFLIFILINYTNSFTVAPPEEC